MFTHNLDPILFDFGLVVIRWYSLAYIAGILIGWWLGKKIIINKFQNTTQQFNLEKFDDLITYLIISILVGGRIGYIVFYNFNYYITNPIDIIKIWEGGMSFHGALIGIIIATYLFSIKKKNTTFYFIRCNIMCFPYRNIFWPYCKFYKWRAGWKDNRCFLGRYISFCRYDAKTSFTTV